MCKFSLSVTHFNLPHTHTCTPGGIQVGVQEGQYLSVVAVGYRERAEVCGGEGGTLLPLTAAELKAATSSLSTEYLKWLIYKKDIKKEGRKEEETEEVGRMDGKIEGKKQGWGQRWWAIRKGGMKRVKMGEKKGRGQGRKKGRQEEGKDIRKGEEEEKDGEKGGRKEERTEGTE